MRILAISDTEAIMMTVFRVLRRKDAYVLKMRIHKVSLQLWKKKGFDILLTHAPAYGLNDMDTLSHRGFECFLYLLEKFKPKYFVHGHVHMSYDHKVPRVQQYGDTTIINAYEYYKFDF